MLFLNTKTLTINEFHTLHSKDMKDNEIKLSWSKREKDWLFSYPNNAGKSLMDVFFGMMRIEENLRFLQPNILNPNAVPQTLKEMLTERGFDYTTLKITCKKLPAKES